MSKEAAKAEDKGTVKNPETELKGAEVRDNIETHNEGVTFEPLFGNEAVTDDQLKGEDDPGEKTADPEPKDDDAKKKSKEAEEKKTDEQKEAELKSDPDAKEKANADAKAKEEAEKGKDGKPELPKEIVENLSKKEEHIAGLTTAVKQERDLVKRLRHENQRLFAENQTLKSPKASADKEAEKFKEFKVLSDEEYESLLDEDPDGAAKYLYRYNKYRDWQDGIHKRQLSEHQAQSAEREIVGYGLQELERVLPGITQGRSDLAGKLTEFAVQAGVDTNVLAVLSDPRTKIVTIDGENLLMGDGAAQFVQLIKSSYEKVSNVPDVKVLRTEIEAELRPKIEAEVQKKLIDKLKKDPSGDFRSLDQLAGSGSKDVKPVTGAISEQAYANMSEAEQRAALGG